MSTEAAALSARPAAQNRIPLRRAASGALAAFALLSIFFSGSFPPFSNPNELSRLEAIVAAADEGTFSIDSVIPRLGDHEDKSTSDGRAYSNKAPGLALAATPVYKLLRLVCAPPASAAAPVFWILRLLTVTLLCVWALWRFWRRLRASPSPTLPAAPLILVALAFGTPFLFFARSFFAHAWTAALLFLSWDALMETQERRRRGEGRSLALYAGLLAGWAAISEYAVAPVAVLLFVRAAFASPAPATGRVGSWRTGALFGVGLAIPLALLAAYDTVCFGSPWVLSSAREAYPDYSRLAGSGLFGFGFPSARVAAAYLFHPARGLLLFSPFLLWSIPGFVLWWRSREDRADCVFALAAAGLYFVAMTGYPNWHGGWSLGNRYLVPILFFPAFAIRYALRSPLSRGLFAAAVACSVGTHVLLSSSWPYFPDNVPWPAATGSAWFLARGWVAPGLWSLLPGSGAFVLALVALASGAVLAAAVRCARPMLPRPAVAALLGLFPVAFLCLRPPALDFGARLWRASIYGAYSGRDPQRLELRAVAESASTLQERRMAIGAWRVYGSGGALRVDDRGP